MLNYESKDRKYENYYNSWSKIKHSPVGSIQLCELGQFKVLEN